jgi:hypothetical protein
MREPEPQVNDKPVLGFCPVSVLREVFVYHSAQQNT